MIWSDWPNTAIYSIATDGHKTDQGAAGNIGVAPSGRPLLVVQEQAASRRKVAGIPRTLDRSLTAVSRRRPKKYSFRPQHRLFRTHIWTRGNGEYFIAFHVCTTIANTTLCFASSTSSTCISSTRRRLGAVACHSHCGEPMERLKALTFGRKCVNLWLNRALNCFRLASPSPSCLVAYDVINNNHDDSRMTSSLHAIIVVKNSDFRI